MQGGKNSQSTENPNSKPEESNSHSRDRTQKREIFLRVIYFRNVKSEREKHRLRRKKRHRGNENTR